MFVLLASLLFSLRGCLHSGRSARFENLTLRHHFFGSRGDSFLPKSSASPACKIAHYGTLRFQLG